MSPSPSPTPQPLDASDLDTLQQLLDAVPPPLEPLDVTMLDGFLCALLLQPRRPALSAWWPSVLDIDQRPPPAGYDAGPLQALALRRLAELDATIERRDWFDPWVYELDDEAAPSEAVMPWVAGFAAAMDQFGALERAEAGVITEPLALLYQHLDADDLEDADDLLAVIETLEPPADLGEAVESLVRATLLLADVLRPRQLARRPAGAVRRPSAKRSRR